MAEVKADNPIKISPAAVASGGQPVSSIESLLPSGKQAYLVPEPKPGDVLWVAQAEAEEQLEAMPGASPQELNSAGVPLSPEARQLKDYAQAMVDLARQGLDPEAYVLAANQLAQEHGLPVPEVTPSALPVAALALTVKGQSRRDWLMRAPFLVFTALTACTPASARPVEPPPIVSPPPEPTRVPSTPDVKPTVLPTPTPEPRAIPYPTRQPVGGGVAVETPDPVIRGIVQKASETAKSTLPDFAFRKWMLQTEEEQWYGIFLAQARDSQTGKLVDSYYLVKPDGTIQFLNQKLTPVSSSSDHWSWEVSPKTTALAELRDQPGNVFAEVGETGEVSWRDLGFAGANFTFTDPSRGEQSLPQGYPLLVRVEKNQTGKPTKIEMKSGENWIEVKSTLKLSPQALEHAKVIDTSRVDVDHIPEWVNQTLLDNRPYRWTYAQWTAGNRLKDYVTRVVASKLEPNNTMLYYDFKPEFVKLDTYGHRLVIISPDKLKEFYIPYDPSGERTVFAKSDNSDPGSKMITEVEASSLPNINGYQVLIIESGNNSGTVPLIFVYYTSRPKLTD